MKFTILQQDLLPALQAVARSAGVHSTLPVLDNILLSVEGQKLKLAATNLEIGVIKSIPVESSIDGQITVPAKTLVELVSNLSSSEVEIASEQETLTVFSGKFKANINGIAAQEFPAIPASSSTSISFPKDILLSSSQILFAAAVDEGRPVLTGILTEVREGKLDLVATDGFRLAHRSIKLQNNQAVSVKSLIPKRTFEEVLKMISEQDLDEVKIALSEGQNQIVFLLDQTIISSTLIEGQFPSWEKIIPQKIITRILVDKGVLLKAIKLAAVFAKNEANILVLTTKLNGLALKSAVKEIGSQENEIEAEVSGEQLQIAFNNKFLQDVVTNIPTSQLMLEFSGSLSAAMIKPIGMEGLEYVVMPVRLN